MANSASSNGIRKRSGKVFWRPALIGVLSIAGCLCGATFLWETPLSPPLSYAQNDSEQDLGKYPDNDFDEVHQLGEKGENRYVEEIRAWLRTLPPFQQQRARYILREAHPELQDLRRAIYDKKTELAALTFGRQTHPEDLPRLGQELQILRRELRGKLQKVSQRLKSEVGVNMGLFGEEGFWLQPLGKAPADTRQAIEIKPNSLRGVFLS